MCFLDLCEIISTKKDYDALGCINGCKIPGGDVHCNGCGKAQSTS